MMRRFNIIGAILLGAALLVSGASPLAAGGGVALRPSAQVDANAIRLSDLFSGLPEGVDREIAVAPAPGKTVSYGAGALARTARLYRIDWQPQSMGDRVVVTRSAVSITAEMLSGAVLEKIGRKKDGARAEVLFDNRDVSVKLPSSASGDFTLENFSYDDKARRFRAVAVADGGDGYPQARLPVAGRIVLQREFPVLARRLAAGTVIGASDLDWATMPDDRVSVDYVSNSDELIGRELRRDTAEGTPLRSRDVAAPRLVLRGGLVTMKMETPNMVITAQGRALQDGAKGEAVRVVNTQSNRTVDCVVEESGVVSVMSMRKLASAERTER